MNSHGIVTVNTDTSKKSDSNRTDLTIPFLQKYPLMSLSTTHGRGVPILLERQSNLKRGKSRTSTLRVVDQSCYIRNRSGYHPKFGQKIK
jgi:hypothetical protein